MKVKLNTFVLALLLLTGVILTTTSTVSASANLPLLPVSSEQPDTYEPERGTTDCKVGYFMCNDTILCIAQRLNCDHTAHCYDGSDEWDCNDRSLDLFWDHLYRKNVKALTDEIPWGSCDYPDLNGTCRCKVKEVHCAQRNLKNIPFLLPEEGITLLDLSGNSFPVLNNKFFGFLPEAQKLVMKHCSIEEIETNAFYRLRGDYVDTLYLDQNKIEILPDELFPNGTRLQVLILTGNWISEIQDNAFLNLNHLVELDLSDNRISVFRDSVFKPLEKLQILLLNKNRIAGLTNGMIPQLPYLVTLSLADNQIRYISRNALNLISLEHLFLSGNQLTEIENHTFTHLPNLLGLNLNDNQIDNFQLAAFDGITNLTSLYLTGNQFKTMDRRVLQNLTHLQHIYFSWFHLCRAAMHVRVCEPRGDGISSAKHLLDNTVLRASVWVMAAVGIVGNLLVLFGRLAVGSRSSQGHAEHSLYLRHLAASDLLMGIYLATIASADIAFRGEYLANEESWRYSTTCAICGFLSTLSCQSSTFLLTLVTWDRLVSVTRPLHPRPPSRARAIFRLAALWGAASAAAAAPLSGTEYFGSHFYGNNGVCLSLHIHDPYAKGWEYSAAMFILVNTVSLVFIGASYVKMLQAIRGSGEAMRSTLSGRENVVARRFAIIVATDCACWLPIIVVKLAALAGVKISPSLYAWLAVLVLPVNSALNPVLYTLTTAAFKQQITKFIYSLPCGAVIDSRSQNGYESALSISLGHFPSGTSKKRLLQRRVSTSSSRLNYKNQLIQPINSEKNDS